MLDISSEHSQNVQLADARQLFASAAVGYMVSYLHGITSTAIPPRHYVHFQSGKDFARLQLKRLFGLAVPLTVSLTLGRQKRQQDSPEEATG